MHSRVAPTAEVEATPGIRRPLISLTAFGIPLGLAGTAGVWAAAQLVGAPQWPGEVLYALSAAFWGTFTALYIFDRFRRRRRFQGDLRHPAVGPFAAYIPLIAVLLASHYHESGHPIFAILCWVSVGALAIVAAQLVAHWLTGGVTLDAVHPGFFIPVVATPALSAFLAAAATSNLAWLLGHPSGKTEAQILLMGILVAMVLIQLALVPTYVTVPFSLNWWTFTFPLASTANFCIRWLAVDERVDPALAIGISLATTVFLAYVTIRSIRSWGAERRRATSDARVRST